MYAMRPVREKVQAIASPTTYFDPKFNAHAMKVLPGEYIVTDRDVMLVTVLGSCVSACIRDPAGRRRRHEPFHAAGPGERWRRQ